MGSPWVDELFERLPERVTADPEVVAAHSQDQARLVAAGEAECLVRATSTADVVTTLEIADRHRVPVVTRGAGTGLTGGANAQDGCILLSVAAMDRILEIDPATSTATVEPGVINADLVEAASGHGLWYAPDPASRDISSIGGNIATNAGGACCLRYGVTRDHVAALRVVLAGGRILETGSLAAKNVAGLDLTSLLVGSEGTLGVIVEATVRLLPRPRTPSTLAAFFPSLEDAGRAIVSMERDCDLSLIELMDRTTVRAVESHARMDLDTDAGALVLAQSDAAAGDIGRAAEIADDEGATLAVHTDQPDEGEQLLQARRLALPALEQLGSVLLDDVAVPKPAIPDLLRSVAKIADRHGVTIGTFGHAGDGNFHPTIVFDATDPQAVGAAREAFREILQVAVDLGGTIAGEHGIGALKAEMLRDAIGSTQVDLMRRIKHAFDPNGILNPGRAY